MDFLDDLVEAVKDFTDELVSDVASGIDTAVDYGLGVYNEVVSSVQAGFSAVADKAVEIVSPAWDTITDFTGETIDKAEDIYFDARDWITNGVDSVIARGSEIYGEAIDIITDWIDPLLDAGSALITDTDKIIIDGTQHVIDDANDQADRAERDASEQVERDLNETTLAYAGILPSFKLPGFPDISGLLPAFGSLLGPIIAGVKQVGDNVGVIAGAMPDQSTISLTKEILQATAEGVKLGSSFTDSDSNKIAQGAYDVLISSAGEMGALIGAPLGLLPVVMDCYSASIGAHAQNRARLLSTPGRIGVNELAAALWRGYIEPRSAIRQAGEQGLDEANFEIMTKLARQLLGANEVITLMLRGLISESEVSDRLGALGYESDDIKHIKSLSQVVPGIQDLIRMAVREAFSPDIAERFGQYEDYPEELTTYAGMNGLSEDWAKRYWASHWDLPSVQLGFEMLHRGVIEQPDLELLLRASDVMPYWRDKIVDISYSPFTRVDIRRMHKLEILDKSEVMRAYQDIGYAPDKAAKLTDFTIEINAEDTKIEEAAERDLTLSMVKTAYQDGMLDDSNLASMISDLGYDKNEAALIIGIEQYRRVLKLKKKQIEVIKTRVMYKKIGLNSAIDQMHRIELPEPEIQWNILDLQLDLEVQAAKTETAESKRAAADAARLAAAEARRAEAERIKAVNEAEKAAERAEREAIDELLKDISMVVKKRLAIAKQRVVLQGITRAEGISLFAVEYLRPEQFEYYVLDLDLALEKLELKRRLKDASE